MKPTNSDAHWKNDPKLRKAAASDEAGQRAVSLSDDELEKVSGAGETENDDNWLLHSTTMETVYRSHENVDQ